MLKPARKRSSWRSYSFSEVPKYFTMSKKSFCAFVEVNGERKARYKRVTNMKITEAVISNLAEDGMRGPIRKKSANRDAEYDSRIYQSAPTYLAYAKDLCENYRFDSAKYRLCINEKRYAAITRSDFAKLKEDMQFLDNALKTVLQDHQAYFQERFVDGLVHPQVRGYSSAEPRQRGLPAKKAAHRAGAASERAG